MNYKLIMLDKPILVSDEPIVEQCYVNRWGTDINFLALFTKEHPEHFENCNKIIATVHPFPNTPSIDFSLLSEEDYKKIGWVNVKKIAEERYESKGWDEPWRSRILDKQSAFIDGFKTGQSHNKKKFTLEDIRYAITQAFLDGMGRDLEVTESHKRIINELTKPKVFDVELWMETACLPMPNIHVQWDQPRITNNKIKITKVL